MSAAFACSSVTPACIATSAMSSGVGSYVGCFSACCISSVSSPPMIWYIFPAAVSRATMLGLFILIFLSSSVIVTSLAVPSSFMETPRLLIILSCILLRSLWLMRSGFFNLYCTFLIHVLGMLYLFISRSYLSRVGLLSYWNF